MDTEHRSISRVISARHSTRSYTETPLAQEDIRVILEAGSLAPSAGNRQPWRFVVVQDGPTRGRLSKILQDAMEHGELETGHALSAAELASIQGSACAIRRAPTLVLVFYHVACPNGQNEFALVDMQGIGACIENMALTATSLGISSLWICDILYVEHAFSELLGIHGHRLAAALALGYGPHGSKHPRAVRLGLEELILGSY